MPISARNRLRGQNHIESVITRRSVEELELKKGDEATAVVKSTEVVLSKP